MRHRSRKGLGLLGTAFIFSLLGILILVNPQDPGSSFEQYVGIALCVSGVLLFVLKLVARNKVSKPQEPETIPVDFSSLFTDRQGFVVAVTFNLFLTATYLAHLIQPNDPTFLYETAMLIIVIEFLTIHSSAFFMSKKYPTSKRILLLVLYSLFFGLIAIGTKNLVLLLFLFFSLFSKFLGQVSQQQIAYTTLSIIVLIPSVLIGVLSGDFLAGLFPIPPDVASAHSATTAGDTAPPQGILATGVLYFGLLSLTQILHYRRQLRSKSQTTTELIRK